MNPADIIAIINIIGYAVGVISEMVDVAGKTVEILKKAQAENRDLTPAEVAEVKMRRDAASLRLDRALKVLKAASSAQVDAGIVHPVVSDASTPSGS